MPDRFGHEVAQAYVVLKEASGPISERQLIEFAQMRLPDFKVPVRIVFAETLVYGPTERSTAKRCVRRVRYRCECWKKTFSHGGHGGHGGFWGAAFVDGGSGPGTSCQATGAPSLRDILQQALTSGACQTIPVSSGMPKPKKTSVSSVPSVRTCPN
jgi:hypothetical protein